MQELLDRKTGSCYDDDRSNSLLNCFLVHGDGGTEEDEEGGSQKGEAQE